MRNVILAAMLLASLTTSACQRQAVQESNVTLNGQTYKVVGAKDVRASAKSRTSQTTDANGVTKTTEMAEQTIILNGAHEVQINPDGTATVDGVRQVPKNGQFSTIRLNGDRITLE